MYQHSIHQQTRAGNIHISAEEINKLPILHEKYVCTTACSVQRAADSLVRVTSFSLHSNMEEMFYFILMFLLFCIPGAAVRAEGT